MAEKDRLRNIKLQLWVTEAEAQLAKDKAAYCELTVSDFIRGLITDGVIVKFESFDIKALANELNKIGVNINQIAKHINEKGGEYDRQDMDNLIKEVREMQGVVYKAVWGLE